MAVTGKRLAFARPISSVERWKTGLKHLPRLPFCGRRPIAVGSGTRGLGLFIVEVPLGKGALSLEIRAVGRTTCSSGLHFQSTYCSDVTQSDSDFAWIRRNGLRWLSADARAVHTCVLKFPATRASKMRRWSSTPSSWARRPS
jgi:hypothetical protein